MLAPTGELNDPTDILAHLFFASGTADTVRLVTPGGTYDCVFRFPDEGAAWLVFPDAAPDLAPGTDVIVAYIGTDDEYRFRSTVTATRSDALRLELPTAIERSDRRLTRRVALTGRWAARFVERLPDGERAYALDDLSDGGAGLLDPEGRVTQVGQHLSGYLALSDGTTLPATLEARHVDTRRDGQRIGARFVEASPDARRALASYLRMVRLELAGIG